MIKEHYVFRPPQNEEIKIWRYMDFTKLISLVESESLYFSRSDMFEDPFEGSYTRETLNFVKEAFFYNAQQEGNPEVKKAFENYSESNRLLAQRVAINCWHMNDHESAAMWSLYLKSSEGIAIQSTYSRLKHSIIDDKEIYLGVVKYIDYENEKFNPGNMFNPFLHKRKSFEHEKELRCLYHKPISIKKGTIDRPIENGISIKVDLVGLIEKIHVAPYAPYWFSDLVKKVLKRFNYNFTVVQSEMNKTPLF
jgi:hypothetical protein